MRFSQVVGFILLFVDPTAVQKTSVDKQPPSEEESKPARDQDINQKLDENMEIVKEEKSSIEEPRKEEQKTEASNIDVEMKPVEAKELTPVAIKQDQPGANAASSVPVVQVCDPCNLSNE